MIIYSCKPSLNSHPCETSPKIEFVVKLKDQITVAQQFGKLLE